MDAGVRRTERSAAGRDAKAYCTDLDLAEYASLFRAAALRRSRCILVALIG
jgi:hypothetical protein